LKIVLDKGYILTQEKIEIAKNMLKDGEPVDKIIKYTGLSVNEIEELK